MRLHRSVMLALAIAATAPPSMAAVTRHEEAPGGLAAEVDGGRLVLTVCSERAVRVVSW